MTQRFHRWSRTTTLGSHLREDPYVWDAERAPRGIVRDVRALTPDRKDRAVSEVATRQYGVITRDQLLACGLSSSAIDVRVRRHWLFRVYRGTYVVGHLAPTPLQREMAAVLAAGGTAVASHDSAAYLWGLREEPEGPPHVTLTEGGCNKPGLVAHKTRSLSAAERTVRWGIPITTPARTVIDLASSATDAELEQMIAEARVTRLFTEAQLKVAAARTRGRRGAGRISGLLDDEQGPAFTRSAAERRFLALVRAAGLPEPRVNSLVAGYEVDFFWPTDRLVVEIDGYAFHAGRDSFERDRLRDAAMAAAGLRVIRITWRQLTREREAVVARLARALAAGQAAAS